MIPRHFHFVFGLKPQAEPFHLMHYLCLASCLEVNRPDRLTLYYHYEPHGPYWERIRDRIERVKVDLVPEVSRFDYTDRAIADEYRYAHHADFIRIDRLIESGGVYADMDTLFVTPYPDAFYEKRLVLGREADSWCERSGRMQPSVCNALMLAAPGSPALIDLRSRMTDALDGSWTAHSCLLLYEIAQAYPDEVTLLGPRPFFRFMWNRRRDLRLLFEGMERDLEGVHSIHLWSHLWWSRRRRDFSRFHAGRITEARVRWVDTTYNVLARPYLPKRRRWWATTARAGGPGAGR
ncbi:MAG: glycosyltransferase [Myxococcota bacterium]